MFLFADTGKGVCGIRGDPSHDAPAWEDDSEGGGLRASPTSQVPWALLQALLSGG